MKPHNTLFILQMSQIEQVSKVHCSQGRVQAVKTQCRMNPDSPLLTESILTLKRSFVCQDALLENYLQQVLARQDVRDEAPSFRIPDLRTQSSVACHRESQEQILKVIAKHHLYVVGRPRQCRRSIATGCILIAASRK